MSIIITDTTLRDGSHSVRHQFSKENIASLVSGMDKAGVSIIEVGHGDGLAGSTCNYGFAKESDTDMIQAAVQTAQNARIAVLLLPGIGTVPDLQKAWDAGARVVRIATHVTEADISHEHIEVARKMGFFTIGFLMMAHRAQPEKVLEEARKMESYGAQVVYATDSAGALLPDGVRQRVGLLKEKLSIPVGFHSHNNLGLAIGNSLAAIEAGATYIDGSLGGLGAGAGNTATEMLTAVLERANIPTGIDLFGIMDTATQVLQPIISSLGVTLPKTQDAMMLGYAGVYSSFMLHARRAAERFGVDYRKIIITAGERSAVGGQEDWLYRIAREIAESK